MTAYLRLVVVVSRPAAMFLLAVYAAVGAARAGHEQDLLIMAAVLTVVAGFLVFSVACNDITDEAIDRVNLPHDRGRALVSGGFGRTQLAAVAAAAAVVALAASATLHWAVAAVVLAGLALSAGYSVRPVRLADRGAVASLVLPAGLVAVPYLVGLMATGWRPAAADLTLLAGLYIGFIGRILLKDFRDVRGDALFGKRTFLVRYGRRRTCLFSSVCWTTGTVVTVAALDSRTPTLLVVFALGLAAALVLLRALSTDAGPRRDEAVIAAVVIIGRGTVLTLLAHLSMVNAHWAPATYLAAMAALAVLTAGQAWTMIRRGPTTRLTAPPAIDHAAAGPRTSS